MANKPTQPTRPQGTNPATGKPYEPIEIPVPKRSTFDKLVKKATRSQRPSR